MSTHNLCFGLKTTNMYTPVHPFYYIKVECKGIFIFMECFPEVIFIVTFSPENIRQSVLVELLEAGYIGSTSLGKTWRC